MNGATGRLAFGIVWRAGPRQLVAVVACQVVAALALAGQLAVLTRLLDRLIAAPQAGAGAVAGLVAAFAVLTIVAGLVGAYVDVARDDLGERCVRTVTDQLIDVASSVELERLDDPEFHDRYERATGSCDEQAWAVVWGLMTIGGGLLSAVAVVAYLLSVSVLLVVVIAAGAVPVFVAARLDGSDAYEFAYEMSPNNRERAYLGGLLAQRRAAPETRVFRSGPFLRRRFGELYDERLVAVRALLRRRLRRSAVTVVIGAITIAAAALVVVELTARGRVDVAQVAVAVAAIQQLAQRLGSVANGAAGLHQARLFLDDYAQLLDEPVHPSAPPPTGQRTAAIELCDVSFRYPGTERDVLRHVDLAIPAGQVVALVGENGSGKTTLAKLLCGLYRPTSGSAAWHGADGVAHPLADGELRAAALFQDFLCYQLPAYDNIALGDTDRHGEADAVIGAGRRVGIDTEIDRLPLGWQTRLSRDFEGGAELSGGQWQRVATARALFRDAPLLVLDEPTAALDPRAERRLYDDLRELAAGRTVVFITHRFSSARRADRILVLHDGALVEDGTHAELMDAAAGYAELFDMQVATYGLAD